MRAALGAGSSIVPAISFSLLRADDHVVLSGRLLNLVVDDVDGVPHVRAEHNSCAIELTPPPQYIVEYADKIGQPTPAQSKPIYASPSRLVFHVPTGRSIPLTVAGVLDAITDLAMISFLSGMSVDPVPDPLDAVANGSIVAERARRASALASRAALPRVAAGDGARPESGDAGNAAAGEPVVALPQSELVAPARLVWTLPRGAARFTHQHEPAEREGRVEQWHTRLGVRTVSGKSAPQEIPVPLRSAKTLRPIGTSTAFTTLVDPAKINSPVDEFAAGHIAVQSLPADGALELDHLRVSTLGATLDLDGSWAAPATIASYRHRIVSGRDEKVRVGTRGRLFPFGHRAVMTSTARRELRQDFDGNVAALVRSSVLTVKDRIKDVAGSGKTGRQWPWRTIEILNPVSPPGDELAHGSGITNLQVGGQPFASVCRATDHSGQVVTFSVPLLFVPDGVSDASARSVWNGRGPAFKRFRLDGQAVGLTAPGTGARATSSPDAATLVVQDALLDMKTDAQGKIVPVVAEYLGSSPVVDGLGQQGATTIHYATQFLDHGFGGLNSGELLVLLDGPVATVGQGAALASASMQVRAISRAVGAVASSVAPDKVAADLEAIAAGAFDPQKWFAGLDATLLFGVFPLGQLLPDPATLDLVSDAPNQTAELIDGRKQFTSTWRTELLQPGNAVSIGPAVLETDGQPMLLTLENTTSVVPGTDEVRSRTVAHVEHAAVALAAGVDGPTLISLAVPSLRFETVDAAAPTVDVTVGEFDFLGPLSWVATLAKLLEGSGLGGSSQRTPAGRTGAAAAESNGTGVQVYDDRVEATLVLAVPGLALGAFSLTDLVFRSDFALFLNGSAPTLTLAFSSPENPFHLTISLFGGGGHLRVKISTEKLVEVVGGLEFGAAVSVNLAGIVKGSASVMAGIAFELRPGDVDLTGYVDMRGHLDVLSLIALTMQVLVLMAYDPDTGKVEGRAKVSVSVKVLFFKKTVSFEVHHEFAGGSGDAARALGAAAALPDRAAWDAYWDTFAAAA